MARRSSSKVSDYLASVRRASAAAPNASRISQPAVSDATATAVADALVGPPVDTAASRAFSAAPIMVRGVGPIAVLRHADGTIDRAVVAYSGAEVAKYRRTSARNPAMRWWMDAGLSGTERCRLLDALAAYSDGPAPASAPRPVVAPAPAIPTVTPAPAAAPTAAPANAAPSGEKRQRSTDPGVSAVLRIVAEYARDATAGHQIGPGEMEREIVAKLRAGELEPIAAWSAAAWLEGRAVTLFGAEHARAMAARDALRSACATFLRATADAPARGVPVDLIMASIGGAA